MRWDGHAGLDEGSAGVACGVRLGFEGAPADGLADGERVAAKVDVEAGVAVGLEGSGGLGPKQGADGAAAPWIESWKLSASMGVASRQALSMNAARCRETMAAAAAASAAGSSSTAVRTSKAIFTRPPTTASGVPASWSTMVRSLSCSRSMRVSRPGRSTSTSVLMRCFQLVARIVPPPRCGRIRGPNTSDGVA